MNLKVGIVGLPNAGKSTLFNALLKRQVAFAANYPFATIEPNVGVVPVPDKRLTKLAEITKAEEKMDALPPIIPATVEFVDIAGLVKGASEGQGLGNKFLSHIREVHLICHVTRYFEDASVVHVAGDVNPDRDREIIETELILADLQTLTKQQEPRGVKERGAAERWVVIQKLKNGMDGGKLARDVVTDPDERAFVSDLQLLTMKPFLSVANVSETQMAAYAKGEGAVIGMPDMTVKDMVLISAKIEAELAGLSEVDQKAYLYELGLASSGLDRLIQKAYELLGLISFLTCGVKEVRAWTIKKGSKAPAAAGAIHTDFEKKFIKAEVVSFDQFVVNNGWKGSRGAGKARSEGKEYEIEDGDVVEFKIGS